MFEISTVDAVNVSKFAPIITGRIAVSNSTPDVVKISVKLTVIEDVNGFVIS